MIIRIDVLELRRRVERIGHADTLEKLIELEGCNALIEKTIPSFAFSDEVSTGYHFPEPESGAAFGGKLEEVKL